MKKTNRWIRPLNWHAPHAPVVRRVSNADLPAETSSPQPAGSVGFQMTNDNWLQVLRCLHLYSQKEVSEEWRVWRLNIRAKILGTVNANTAKNTPVAVPLSESQWREILQYTGEVCAEQGDQWRNWYHKLKTHVEQSIKNSR